MHKIKKPGRNIFVTIIIGLTLLCSLQTMPLTIADDGNPQFKLHPDVKITSITFSNDNPDEEEEITISVVICNNETTDITNMTITFSYDMTPLKNITDLLIGAKENRTINITWKSVKWDHKINVMVSIGGIPIENSIMSKEIFVKAKPIGNVLSLVIALIFILVTILGTTIVPSIFGRLKCEGSKKGV